MVYPFLTRKTLKESEIDLFGVLSDSESDSDEEFKKKTKKVKKKKEKEQKKEVKQGYKIKFKILNNEESFFAKDLSSMLIPKNKFFTWFEIWSIPTIDYYQHISQADENWEMDGETLVSVFQNYFESSSSSTTTSQWLTLFPEVNILTEKDLRMQNISGEKHYLPILENVLYPRFGAFANAVGGLYKTDFTRLYDITLLYYNRNKVTGEILDFNPPTLLNILGLRNWNIETVLLVNVSGKFLSRVPLKRNKLEKYLENRWIKKDKLISKLKKRIMKENDAIMKLSEENND